MKLNHFIVLLFIFIGFGIASASSQQNEITWYSLDEAQQLASENNKLIFLFVEAPWCIYCKKMEREAFVDEHISEVMMEYYYPVRLNLDSDRTIRYNGQRMTEAQFAEKHNLWVTPASVFLSADGTFLGKYEGYIPEHTFEKLIRDVGSGTLEASSFSNYSEN